jgi:predicted dehydrogenase
MSAPIPVALLGAGIFAREAHMPALLPLISDGSVTIAAIWSRTPESATRLADLYVGKGVAKPLVLSRDEGLSTLLDTRNPAVAAVVLAVPIAMLSPLSLRALKSGIHVLAEKPLASTQQEGYDALAEYARMSAPGRPLYCVAENFRCEEALMRGGGIVEGLGGAISVELVAHCIMRPGSKYAQGWRIDGGNDTYGQMIDGGVHYLAGLRVVAGADISRLAARTQLCSSHLPGVDTAHALLEFENGVAGTLACTFAAENFKWELTALCLKGRVTLRRASVDGKYGYVVKTEFSDGTPATEEFLAFSGVDNEFRVFFDSVQAGEIDHRLSASAAFNDLAVVTSMVESSKCGQFIDVLKPP